MSAFHLRQGRADDHAAVTALALRSKAFWGYSASFLAACRQELTFTSKQCSSPGMRVAERDGSVIGFALIETGGADPELSALFVDPGHMRGGVGSALLLDALNFARDLRLDRLILDSEPGAEPFYLRHGARRIGEVPSGSIPGRVIPRLRFDLE